MMLRAEIIIFSRGIPEIKAPMKIAEAEKAPRKETIFLPNLLIISSKKWWIGSCRYLRKRGLMPAYNKNAEGQPSLKINGALNPPAKEKAIKIPEITLLRDKPGRSSFASTLSASFLAANNKNRPMRIRKRGPAAESPKNKNIAPKT